MVEAAEEVQGRAASCERVARGREGAAAGEPDRVQQLVHRHVGRIDPEHARERLRPAERLEELEGVDAIEVFPGHRARRVEGALGHRVDAREPPRDEVGPARLHAGDRLDAGERQAVGRRVPDRERSSPEAGPEPEQRVSRIEPQGQGRGEAGGEEDAGGAAARGRPRSASHQPTRVSNPIQPTAYQAARWSCGDRGRVARGLFVKGARHLDRPRHRTDRERHDEDEEQGPQHASALSMRRASHDRARAATLARGYLRRRRCPWRRRAS